MNRQTHHLLPALGAILLTLGFLAGFNLYAQDIENRYTYDLVQGMAMEDNAGVALQHAAFQQPDSLVVYGSSEMLFPRDTKYRATEFFKSYPTGFTVINSTFAAH